MEDMSETSKNAAGEVPCGITPLLGSARLSAFDLAE